MKVIDLLNKIANGEIPKKIIYLPNATNNVYAGKYNYEKGDYLKDGWSNMWLFREHLKAKLNDEVEIIEEDKKIEKIDIEKNAMNRSERCIRKEDNKFIDLSIVDYELANKINELIEEIEKLKESK